MKAKVVKKPWGIEKLIVKTDRYAMKEIVIEPGHRLSLQYHKQKEETVYVLEGKLWISDGTAEGPWMGNTRLTPGSIPFTVARMRSAGLTAFPFEQQVGVEHDQEDAWVRNILWRTLRVITPYEQRVASSM